MHDADRVEPTGFDLLELDVEAERAHLVGHEAGEIGLLSGAAITANADHLLQQRQVRGIVDVIEEPGRHVLGQHRRRCQRAEHARRADSDEVAA